MVTGNIPEVVIQYRTRAVHITAEGIPRNHGLTIVAWSICSTLRCTVYQNSLHNPAVY